MKALQEIPPLAQPRTIKTIIPLVFDFAGITLMWNFEAVLLGHLSANVLAGVGIASQIILGIATIFLTFILGATIIITRCLGANQREEANQILGQSLVTAFILSILIGIVLYFFSPFILKNLFALEAEAGASAIDYTKNIAFFLPVIVVNFVLMGLIRGSGDTFQVMVVSVFTSAVNAFLAVGFIMGAMGFPLMGPKGAGYAMGIANCLGLVVNLRALFSKKTRLSIAWRNINKIDLAALKRLFKVGWPNTAEVAIWTVGLLILAGFASRISALVLAAHQIVLRIQYLIAMLYQAFAIGNMSLSGFALGAKNKEAMKRIKLKLRVIAGGFAAFFALVLLLFAHKIIPCFTPETELIRIAVPVLRFLALIQLPRAFDILILSDLRVRGDLLWIVKITAMNLFIFEIGLASTFTYLLNFGLMGLWAIIGLDESTKIIIHSIRLRRGVVKTV
ncbi:MATE family efflux transporter [bacterium]|nr:MATE family efflux transporter [bacterium]